MSLLDLFNGTQTPETPDTTGGTGADSGTFLGALGQGLLTGDRYHLFGPGLGQAVNLANQAAAKGTSRTALKALLLQAGATPAQAEAFSANENIAKLAIGQINQQKVLGDGGAEPALPGMGGAPAMSPPAPAGPAAGVTLNGSKSDKAKAVYDGLIQRGASPVFAAGMTGNIDVESDGFNPAAVGDKGTAFGYHQARGDRFNNLQTIAKAKGVGWQDHDAQLDNIAAEWNGKDAGMAKAKALIEADPNMTPAKAAAIIAQYGERPSKQALADSLPRRAGTATQVFSQFGQPAPVQTADNSGAVPKVPVAPVTQAPLAPVQGQNPGRPVQVANSEEDTQRLEGRMGMYPPSVYSVAGPGNTPTATAQADLPAPGAQAAAFQIPPGAADAVEKKVGAPPPPVNETIGATTQKAQAVQNYNYWAKRLRASGTLGEAGKGLAEEAKQRMELASKFLTPTEAERAADAAGLTGDARSRALAAAIPGNAPTTGEKETEYVLANPGKKETLLELKAAGAQTEQDAFKKGAAQINAKRFGDMREAGDKSQAALGDFQNLRELSAVIGNPGAGAKAQALLGPYVSALGIDSKGLSPLQQYNAVIQKLAPQMHVAGSGATSDIEFKGMLNALGDATLTPQARAAIHDSLESAHRYNIARSDIATSALSGDITSADADKQLRALPNPLQGFRDYKKAHPDEFGKEASAQAEQPVKLNTTERALSIQNAKAAIAKNPSARDAILERLRGAGIPTDAF